MPRPNGLFQRSTVDATIDKDSRQFPVGTLCQTIIGTAHGNEALLEETDFLLVTGTREPCVLVNRYRQMRFLPTPLHLEDWNELVLVRQAEAVETAFLRIVQHRTLVFTNKSLQADRPGTGLRQWRYLRCRYSTNGLLGDNRRGQIRALSSAEIPSDSQASFRARNLRIPDEALRQAWLGSTTVRAISSAGQYTIGDAFCGAGGASQGAKLAGLNVSWGFDFDVVAGRSYRSNFPTATFHQIDAQQFHTINAQEIHVDVLHLSPSCQAFSAMNTTEDGGQQGEYNRDSFLSCLEIVRHVRPRIATMEQVPGILYDRSSAYFNNFLRGLVALGFSVTWKVLAADHFGVPQSRKRLILIASCPGHALPMSPMMTSRRPKVNDYLPGRARRAEFDDKWHETITTKGGTALDGSPLSRAELQAIQSFPRTHIFCGNEAQVRRQIGNAIPPQLARCLFLRVLRCLEQVDCEPIVIQD